MVEMHDVTYVGKVLNLSRIIGQARPLLSLAIGEHGTFSPIASIRICCLCLDKPFHENSFEEK